jgi:EAL domain-containing protein (putative c-di-GMP-specific phosphodiesterase class I)
MEITESVIIDKPQKVASVLHSLSRQGVKFALDDFGTGFSSLSYLQKYPFDFIKIDRSFIEDILVDENDEKITLAIISLAKSLGIKVTAEGVTSQACLDKLEAFGANHYQGYFLGKPLEEARLLALFNTANTETTKFVREC